MSNLRANSAPTYLIEDNILGSPGGSKDPYIESYDVDRNCTVTPCKNSLLTSSPSVQSIVPMGFSIPQGTLTSSQPFINQSATWNSGSTVFTNLFTNVTNTSSASGSLLVNHEVGGSSVWDLDPSGDTNQTGNLNLLGSTPTISSTATNANLNLTPNGTGVVAAPSLSLTGATPTISSTASNGNLNLAPNGSGIVAAPSLSLTGAAPTISSTASNANLNLTPNGTGLVTAPTPTSATDNSTDVATTAFVQAHLPQVAGKVALTGQTANTSGTLISSPVTGTYMLSLCVWVQATGLNTVTATVAYHNGTIATSDSSGTMSTASTSNRNCSVISEHIASGTPVTYSTAATPTTPGTYGLDIVETRVQ
jgi:hypothetical protein